MADTLAFELVTPDRIALALQADQVNMPGGDGDLGILPGHAPLITTLRPGVIEVLQAGKPDERIFVGGGLAEVASDRLTVLVEEAVPLASLDRAALERRIRDAEEDVADAANEEIRRRAALRLEHLRQLHSAVAA